MNTEALSPEPTLPLSQQGSAPPRVIAGYGFWLFLLSDIILFSALFAAYAVLSDATSGGPRGVDLFDKRHVFMETLCLLTSSVTCGYGTLAVARANTRMVGLAMLATFVLGATFLWMEVTEFVGMVAAGAGPSHSAFLSAFFALVGTHGLHVTLGLVWLVIMMLQLSSFGYLPMVARRFFCFGLFWHALDIVWIGVFSIVYLGAHR